MVIAGVFKYGRDAGPADLALCILLDGGGLVSIGMNGRISSMVIITLDRYWKIVHSIHHRKYYRRWMLKVGVMLPWLNGFLYQLVPTAAASRVVNGKCLPMSIWPNKIMLLVCALSVRIGMLATIKLLP